MEKENALTEHVCVCQGSLAQAVTQLWELVLLRTTVPATGCAFEDRVSVSLGSAATTALMPAFLGELENLVALQSVDMAVVSMELASAEMGSGRVKAVKFLFTW